jgi:hypothetical protein
MRRIKNQSQGDRPNPRYTGVDFRKPASDETYIKILQYVADHPECKRAEILVGIGRYKTVEQARKEGHAQWSGIFSKLLYKDYLDYDEKTFKYHITEKGQEVLENSYLNDMEDMVKGKPKDKVKAANYRNRKSGWDKDERYAAEKEVMSVWKSWANENGLWHNWWADEWGEYMGIFFDLYHDHWVVKVLLGEDVPCSEEQWAELVDALEQCEGIVDVAWEDDGIGAISFYWEYLEPLGGEVIPFDERWDGAATRKDYEQWVRENN